MRGELGTPIANVLDQMLLENGSLNPETVGAYCNLYPQHRDAIVEFAAGWAEEIHLPMASVEEQREKAVAASAVEGFRRAAQSLPARSLAELASAVGQTLDDIAHELDVNNGVIAKLNARRIAPDSIRSGLVSRIARLLGVDGAAVSRSWSVAPQLQGAAAFLGTQVRPAQQSLREALAETGADPAIIEDLAV